MEPVKVKLIAGENALKQVRKALGMTQTEFAQAIGAHQVSVARWENGQTKPLFSISQMKALKKLMETIKLDIDDLPDDL